MTNLELKKALYDKCMSQIAERLGRLEKEMDALKHSAESDTKSSMGDKYETGREMINLEKGKIASQLTEVHKLRQILTGLDMNKNYNVGELGAMVLTTQNTYFIAISLGKLSLPEKDVFVISPATPIGQQLLNKRVEDCFSFAGKEVQITEIL